MDLDKRVRFIIGDLMVNNAGLMAQIEELQKEVSELKKDKEEKEAKE